MRLQSISIFTTILFFFLLEPGTYGQSQTKKLAKTIKLSKGISLGFGRFNSKTGLYYHPRIIQGGRVLKITGYDEDNGSDEEIKVAPNKRFFMMGHIIKEYVKEGKKRKLHENYLCVLIDIKRAKVVKYMQTDCGGEWSKGNEWVSGGSVVFSPEDEDE